MRKILYDKKYLVTLHKYFGFDGVINKINKTDIILTEDKFSDNVINAVLNKEFEELKELFKEKKYEHTKKTRGISTT